MQTDRRLVLTDRIIPFLAALVGLVALAAAVVVHENARVANQAVLAEIGQLRQDLSVLMQRGETLSTRIDQSGDDGTAEALLALQERIARLEDSSPATPAPLELGSQALESIDPSLPTTDCIPRGTRFMVTGGESFPICQTSIVVTASAISSEMVALDNGVTLVPGTPAPMPGGACTASVLSTDAAGFAELRVDCR